MERAEAMQCFSDGGYTPGHGGAFGVQLLAFLEEEGTFQRILVGHMYQFVDSAKSAFDMEVQGLDAATKLLHKALETNP